MAASFPLAAILAVACFFVALLPTSAAPAMTLWMEPRDNTKDSKMAISQVTSAQEIEQLQENVDGKSSDVLLNYTIGLTKEGAAQLAADMTTKPLAPMDIESDIHRRSLRSDDSTPSYSSSPLQVHVANLPSVPTAEFTGYPSTGNRTVPGHSDQDLSEKDMYAPANYVPPAARALARKMALAKTAALAHSLASAPAPTQAHTAAAAKERTLGQAVMSSPSPELAHTRAFASSPAPKKIMSIMNVWNRFLTKPLQENYDKFVAILPAKSVRSLLLDHQHFDFTSVQDYRADKEGFVSAMQKVYQVPKEQLGEVEDFYDMMTKVLPSKFFGKERSVADLIRQIRLYFAMKHPRVKVMSAETVAHYNLK